MTKKKPPKGVTGKPPGKRDRYVPGTTNRVTGKVDVRYFPRFTTILRVTRNLKSVTGNPRKFLRSPTLTLAWEVKKTNL